MTILFDFFKSSSNSLKSSTLMAFMEAFAGGLVSRGNLELIEDLCTLILHPITVISKKQGKLKLQSYFWALNGLVGLVSIDIRDRQNLERELLEKAKSFTALNIKDAFFQIRIDDPQMRKFFGVYILLKSSRFTCLPHGWKNSLAICQLTYESILGTQFTPFCRLFMDKIKVFSKPLEEHWQHVNMVLTRLEEHNVEVVWSKTEITKSSEEYLWIDYRQDGISSCWHIFEKSQSLINVDCSKFIIGDRWEVCNIYFNASGLDLQILWKNAEKRMWNKRRGYWIRWGIGL